MDRALHERLERLHAELATIDATDSEQRETIERLRADVRAALDEHAGGREPEYGPLAGRMRDAVTRLETAYPNATLAMGQFVDALANLGL